MLIHMQNFTRGETDRPKGVHVYSFSLDSSVFPSFFESCMVIIRIEEKAGSMGTDMRV